MKREITPQSGEVISVTIIEVDMANRMVHAEDRTGGSFAITFRATGAFLQVPQIGEHWTANRVGFEWHLGNKIPDPDSPLTGLSPGDMQLETSGNIHLNTGDTVYVNGVEIGTGGTGASESFATRLKWGNSS